MKIPYTNTMNISSTSSIVFFVLVISSLWSQYEARSVAIVPVAPAATYEFVLAMQWNPTVCNGSPRCASINFPKRFTVHGLWIYPQTFCSTGMLFDPLFVKPIEKDLNLIWTNAEGGTNAAFWGLEWRTHGRCSYFQQVRPFFQNVVDLVKWKDFSSMLVPLMSASDLDEGVVYQRLSAFLGRTVGMVCIPNPGGNQKLKEIRLYFKFQVGTGYKGWTLYDYPNTPASPAPRCYRGRVHLPN